MKLPEDSSNDYHQKHAEGVRRDLLQHPATRAIVSSWRYKLRTFLQARPIRRVLRGLDVIGAVLIRTKLGAYFVYFLIPGARPPLCSNCLVDNGLRLDAEACGIVNAIACPNCGSRLGKRLTKHLIEYLTYRFFVRGSVIKYEYGAAPGLQFNSYKFRKGDYKPSTWLERDLHLLSEAGGFGAFHYGPRAWMYGALRGGVIARILNEYPSVSWPGDEAFFRVRVNPSRPDSESEYDSPPDGLLGNGRLDSRSFPVLYCSQDMEGCIHECRVTAEDEVYAATLAPARPLRLLNLTVRLDEPFSVTEFESLDMAVHMLFSAGAHSYEISRAIALAAQAAGFDGLLCPSYFSLLRSGKENAV